MATRTTFSLMFYIKRGKIKKNGECPIYMRITINGDQVTASIKRSVAPEIWNSTMGKCDGKNKEAKEINKVIDTYTTLVHNKHQELLTLQDEVTAEYLRDHVFNINTAQATMLCEIWEDHVADLKKMIGKGSSYTTYQKFNTSLKYMREFLHSEYNVKDISVKRLNASVVSKFQIFLRTIKSCNYNTSIKYLQNFKRIVMIAFRNGWIRTNPFADFKLTLKEVDRPFLTEDEIQKIISLELPTKRLDTVRDMFIFACFSGMSYSDVKQLKRSEIEADPNGTVWIRTRRQKTKIKAQIPLLEIPKMIIDKYADLDELDYDDKVLPVMSNQKMNSYLKEIQEMCGIDKRITYHIARHTFATTVTMMHGVPIESVSRMLGHTNIKTTQHYARIVDSKIGKDMDVLSQKLNGKFNFGF